MIRGIDKAIGRMSELAAGIGAVIMLLIFVMQVIDIIGSKAFNRPFPGAVELTGYAVAVLAPAAAAKAWLAGQHVRIEVFTEWLPVRVKAMMDRVIALLVAILLAVVVWRLVDLGMDKQASGQYSDTLHFPFYYAIYLEALAFAPFCLAALYTFWRTSKRETVDDESV